jgi:hypothetical protein
MGWTADTRQRGRSIGLSGIEDSKATPAQLSQVLWADVLFDRFAHAPDPSDCHVRSGAAAELSQFVEHRVLS